MIILRVTTRRVLRSATPLDMVVIFAFGGLAVQAIVGADTSATAAFTAIFALSVMHVLLSIAIGYSPVLRRIIRGQPVIVFEDGKMLNDRLNRLRIEEADLLSEVRQSGMRSFDEVDCIIIEHQGGISVLPKKD